MTHFFFLQFQRYLPTLLVVFSCIFPIFAVYAETKIENGVIPQKHAAPWQTHFFADAGQIFQYRVAVDIENTTKKELIGHPVVVSIPERLVAPQNSIHQICEDNMRVAREDGQEVRFGTTSTSVLP
ncbi:MAG: hypothetical protein ACRCUY_05365, partial [Thermoguttaceae bacterium]